MKNSNILFISDIHGIADNLEKIIKLDLIINFKKIIVLGDLFTVESISKNKNTNVEKVKDFLIKFKEKVICLKGNNDNVDEIINMDINCFDKYYILDIDGFKFFCTHGDNLGAYNITRDLYDVVIYGHEHKPYVIAKNNLIYTCVGSISLPAEDCEVSYAIYNNAEISLFNLDNVLICSKKIR